MFSGKERLAVGGGTLGISQSGEKKKRWLPDSTARSHAVALSGFSFTCAVTINLDLNDLFILLFLA